MKKAPHAKAQRAQRKTKEKTSQKNLETKRPQAMAQLTWGRLSFYGLSATNR
jgi:hypothetical protein